MSAAHRVGDLCVVACSFSADALFCRWVEQTFPSARTCSGSRHAKEFILTTCGIQSRKELDTSSAAADLFHRVIRRPFLDWKAQQNLAPQELTGAHT